MEFALDAPSPYRAYAPSAVHAARSMVRPRTGDDRNLCSWGRTAGVSEIHSLHLRSRPRLPVRLARLFLVLTLEVAVVLTLVSILDAAPALPSGEEAVATLEADAVAAAPADFRAGKITVAGQIQPRPERVSRQDRSAFVLEGAEGRRLLVVPAENERLPGYRAGTHVLVHGDIVIPPGSARLQARIASRTAVAQRAQASAVLKATEVTFVR